MDKIAAYKALLFEHPLWAGFEKEGADAFTKRLLKGQLPKIEARVKSYFSGEIPFSALSGQEQAAASVLSHKMPHSERSLTSGKHQLGKAIGKLKRKGGSDEMISSLREQGRREAERYRYNLGGRSEPPKPEPPKPEPPKSSGTRKLLLTGGAAGTLGLLGAGSTLAYTKSKDR